MARHLGRFSQLPTHRGLSLPVLRLMLLPIIDLQEMTCYKRRCARVTTGRPFWTVFSTFALGQRDSRSSQHCDPFGLQLLAPTWQTDQDISSVAHQHRARRDDLARVQARPNRESHPPSTSGRPSSRQGDVRPGNPHPADAIRLIPRPWERSQSVGRDVTVSGRICLFCYPGRSDHTATPQGHGTETESAIW
jgi:hypothetical protein